MDTNDIFEILKRPFEGYIKNPTEFLSSLYNSNSFKNNVPKNSLILKNEIGNPSVVGKVYETGNDKIIIKESVICAQNANSFTQDLCKMLNEGSFIYLVPNTLNGKIQVLAPNYIIEPLIGMIISNDLEKYSSSFMQVYGFDIEEDEGKTIMSAEKLDPDLQTILNNAPTDYFLYYLFQIIHAITVGQCVGKFVHYDLHINNVIARITDEPIIHEYILANGKIVYTLSPFDAVIIDYGMARYEKDNNILSSRYEAYIYSEKTHNLYNSYQFNPYYDIYLFLTFWLNYLDNQELQDSIVDYTEKVELVTLVLTIFLQTSNLDIISRINIPNIRTRPDPNKLYQFNLLKPHQLLYKIVELMEKYKSNSVFKVLEEIENVPKKTFLYPDKCIDITFYNMQFEENMQFENILITTIKNDQKVPQIGLFNNIFTTSRPLINFTGDTFILSRNQIVNIAGINPGGPGKFRFDCCRIPLTEYFQNNKFKGGIAINASFFNIKSDYMPVGSMIGNFDKYSFNYYNLIPAPYKKYYGYICIKNNKITILPDSEEIPEADSIISAGPILVNNGIIFDYNIIEENKELVIGTDTLAKTNIWICGKDNNVIKRWTIIAKIWINYQIQKCLKIKI
jgi:hypothetical protein